MERNPQFEHILDVIRDRYPGQDSIPLHAPVFHGKEKEYLTDTIDSTFVSSVGKFVDRFEEMMTELTGAKYAVATVNGTLALHMALLVAGVEPDDEVLVQDLTFIATANAISYIHAHPVFLDIDRETLGLSASKLEAFLLKHAEIADDGDCINKTTGRRIKACVPMHTFGHPCKVDEIVRVCKEWNITVIEDAAESVGSYYKQKHTGIFGRAGIFSFNGNKTITCGGGGAIVTDDEYFAKKAKHLTTQAKKNHRWKYEHDAIGYNYRLPNLNAALACAQLEQLDDFVESKRDTAAYYAASFKNAGLQFQNESSDARSNFWLNAIFLSDEQERDDFLDYSNSRGVMTRPAWTLMHKLPMFKEAQTGEITNASEIEKRLVNIPSSVQI